MFPEPSVNGTWVVVAEEETGTEVLEGFADMVELPILTLMIVSSLTAGGLLALTLSSGVGAGPAAEADKDKLTP